MLTGSSLTRLKDTIIMPSISQIELTDKTKRRVFFSTGLAAWVAILGVVLLAMAMTVIVAKWPKRTDVISEINQYVDASFWARDYLLLWLGGKPTQAAQLESMTILPGRPELNEDPLTVLDIRSAPGILRTPAADGKPEVEWAMTLAAVIVPPGSGGASVRTFYRVTFLQAGATFKALMYPRPVNATAQPVQIQPHYTTGVSLDGPVAKTVRDFMSAFYTTGNDGQLGRFVSGEFKEDPLAGSPYTTVEVTGIASGSDSADPAQAKPGDVMHILVTAKASSSTKTFNLINAPLRISLSPNKQWLVDGFDEPIRFGNVSYQ